MKMPIKRILILSGLIIALTIIVLMKLREEKPGALPPLPGHQAPKSIYDPDNLPPEEPIYSNYTPPPPKNGPGPQEQIEIAKQLIEEDKKKSLVEGIVVQKGTSSPIAKAIVRLNGSIINITDESGKFAYSVLPGTYNIYAIYSYDSNIRSNHEQNIIITENQKYFFKLELSGFGKIDGIVLSENGEPINNARISIFNPFFGEPFIVFDSNEDGKFSYDYLKPINELEANHGIITYRITASHNDYLYYKDFVPIYAGKTSTIKIILTKCPLPMIVTGKITDNLGNPIQEIAVRHKYAEPGEYTLAQQEKEQLQYSKDAKIRGQQDISSFTSTYIDTTNEAGEYTKKIMMIDYNKLYLIIKPQQKYAAYETELPVMPGKTYELNIILPEGQHVTGTVLDKKDNPLEKASVYAIPAQSDISELQKSGNWQGVETNADGRFDVGNLTPGLLYDVYVDFSGYADRVELKNVSVPALDLIIRTPFIPD